jgi:Spy/CpxP family protein refolding chaperone
MFKKMTVRNKLFAVLSSFLMVFAVGTFAFAQETMTRQDDSSKQDAPQAEKGFRHPGGHRGFGKGFGHRGGMRGGMMHGGFGKLNLSEEQKGQLKSLRENFRTSTETQRKEMFTLFQQKRDGTLNADGEARMKEIHSQMKAAGQGLHSSMLGVLTPEQKTQLETMKQEFRQKMQERRKMRQSQPQAPAAPSTPETKDNSQ